MSLRAIAVTTAALLGAGTLLVPAARAAAPVPDTPVVVAHRGASGYAPENTLAAVDKAAELGARWVETDVQRTRDGRLVIMHDTDLRRTTDVEQVFPDRAPWNVRDFTAREIARLDAGSWRGAAFAGTRVPTLRQFVDDVERHHQGLLLELKSPELYPGIEDEVLRALRGARWLDEGHVRERLVVQSFDADSIRAVHTRRPDVTTGFLGAPDVSRLPAYAAFAGQVNPDLRTVSADWIRAAHGLTGPHGRPLEVFAWTLNDAVTVRRAAALGVDGVISNVPDVALAALSGTDPAAPIGAGAALPGAGAAFTGAGSAFTRTDIADLVAVP